MADAEPAPRACASTGRARNPISAISEMPARRGHPNAAVKFTGLRHVPLAAHHLNLHDLLRFRKGTRRRVMALLGPFAMTTFSAAVLGDRPADVAKATSMTQSDNQRACMSWLPG